MNRRTFIGTLIGGVATAAAVRTWPFRIYSFPSELTIISASDSLPDLDFTAISLSLDAFSKEPPELLAVFA